MWLSVKLSEAIGNNALNSSCNVFVSFCPTRGFYFTHRCASVDAHVRTSRMFLLGYRISSDRGKQQKARTILPKRGRRDAIGFGENTT